MHLLKKLKVTLKESALETVTLLTDINEILQDIRIASIRHQVWMVQLANNSLKRETYMIINTQDCVIRPFQVPYLPYGVYALHRSLASNTLF